LMTVCQSISILTAQFNYLILQLYTKSFATAHFVQNLTLQKHLLCYQSTY